MQSRYQRINTGAITNPLTRNHRLAGDLRLFEIQAAEETGGLSSRNGKVYLFTKGLIN
jgi:hypothetical protein